MQNLKLGIIMVTLAVLSAHGQDFSLKPNGSPADITLEISDLQAELVVEGTNESEIKFLALEYDNGIPEKAKGLKPLSAVEADNTSIGLFVKQEGSTVKVSGTGRRADEGTYKVMVPSGMNVRIAYTGWQSGDLEVSGITGELEIKSNTADIRLDDVTGPVVLNTLSSDIEVKFQSVSQSGPTAISSTSGDIDVTLPPSAKGNFKLSSMSGDIYTNIDFEMENKEKEGLTYWITGTSAKATLNGGGVDFKVNAISGDVFIRKAE